MRSQLKIICAVSSKTACCGCEACVQICPKHCIKMQCDSEGFQYPTIDNANCIECHLCEQVCPINVQNKTIREPLQIHLVKNSDENIRAQSSSGGAFQIIAERIIKENGVVFGAYFDKDWNVVHGYVEKIEELKKLRGSKYVQSHIGNAYLDAKKFLIHGRKVLFSGTPCQIAALNKFLNKDYDNLYTVDFICHGVPSPQIWSTYLSSIVKHINQPIENISFRNKIQGWKSYCFSVTFAKTDKSEEFIMYEPLDKNPYLKGFIADLFLRPSCHNCHFKSFANKSDITLADAWGMWDFAPEQYDDKGHSLLITHTQKGNKLISSFLCQSTLCPLSIIEKYNPAAYTSPKATTRRSKFFRLISKYDFDTTINKCLPPPRLIDKVLWSINKRLNKYVKK